MSYILDSIKKSDKERTGKPLDAPEHLKIPAYLDAPDAEKQRPFSLVIVMAAVIAILVLTLLWILWLNQKAPQASIASQSPATQIITESTPPKAQTSSEDKVMSEEVISSELASSEGITPTNDVNDNVRSEAQTIAVDSLYQTREQQATMQTPDVIVTEAPESVTTEAIVSRANIPSTSEPVPPEQIIDEPIVEFDTPAATAIPSVFSLDVATQRTIPAIKYDAHIYASDNNSGFVILNGVKKQVGDSFRSGLFVEKINQEDVVLSYNGLLFSLPALKSWSYQ